MVASIEATWYKPRNSSWTSSSWVTQRRIKVTCYWFELLVVSSAITVRKGGVPRSAETCCSTWRPITFMISFWIAGLVYTFSFCRSHSAKFGSSSAFILSSWSKFPSDSLLTASPCLAKNLMQEIIWCNACRFFSFWAACCCESCSSMSHIV